LSTIVRKALLLLVASNAGAQNRIPVRTIGPILAVSTENVGPAINVRGTSDGHVIVGASGRERVYAFDSTLLNFTIVADSGTGTATSKRVTGLIPYRGDSTLLPDRGSDALLLLDPTGKQVRSIAPPHASDLFYLAVPARFGHPALDSKGRLIYRSALHVNMQTTPAAQGSQTARTTQSFPDTSPIVRGSFDTRTVDTLAWLKTGTPGRTYVERQENPSGGPPAITVRVWLNPFPTSDEWAMLTDGTIAIVRVHDYHIDWIDPDGSKRSTAKMPMDWRRYTDAEKQQRADSVKRDAEEHEQTGSASGRGAAPQMKTEFGIVPDSEFPTFWPPITAGSVLADLDNHLWILPTTSTNAANGFTYDVINRDGVVFERVQLPTGHVLAGFGPNNVVYLTKANGSATYLERALFPSPSAFR